MGYPSTTAGRILVGGEEQDYYILYTYNLQPDKFRVPKTKKNTGSL